LASYRNFLEHNELKLALDILEDLGEFTSARGEFGVIWSEPPKTWPSRPDGDIEGCKPGAPRPRHPAVIFDSTA